MQRQTDLSALIRPGRPIAGMSAVLLPSTPTGSPDWAGFERLLGSTLEAGLVPAVDMDTGHVDLIDDRTWEEVLAITQRLTGGSDFAAGAYVADEPGAAWAPDRYRERLERIQQHGGIPVVFPSHGMVGLGDEELIPALDHCTADCDRFIGFELGHQFHPAGRILDLDQYRALMEIPRCIGAKHSSLERIPEWERLRLRDAVRPDFLVLTGNDLAIDMVMYGSDYLLGLATFAPDAFALRDRWWAEGDPRFHQLNDVLQFLGAFAFRAPVPAYKHSAAQFLALRGIIDCDAPHPDAVRRPDSDREILATILERLERELAA